MVAEDDTMDNEKQCCGFDKRIMGVAIAIVFGIVIYSALSGNIFGQSAESEAEDTNQEQFEEPINTGQQNQEQEPEQTISKEQLFAEIMDDDPVKGDPNAPVVIVEFSDFECPFCVRYYQEAYRQIEEEYVKTGKVRYVFRDYPLGFHPYAQKAAEASQCADDQGKFWEMHDKLFENQDKLDVSSLKQYAKDLELDSETFDQCLDSGKYEQEIVNDIRDAADYGIQGTPTFIINDKIVVGAQPFSEFKKIIDAELEG